MELQFTTTPFGRRRMTLGQVAIQMQAREVSPDALIHKWQVFNDVREARDMLGATDRALAILNALLTYHPETMLQGDGSLVVFPSNESLIQRANGMSPATLRRHLAVLVSCGLIIRRDSPNGKRFARKGRGGVIEQAFGFDLTPLVARAADFKEMAESVRAEKLALRRLRERITICRRDIVKMIDTGLTEGVPGDWRGMEKAYSVIASRMPRQAPLVQLEALAEEMETLWARVRQTLESFINSHNMTANESHSERHIQNSNTNPKSESEESSAIKHEASGSAGDPDNLRHLPQRELPLGIVVDACPNILWVAKDGVIRHWRDLIAAAELVRPSLGISASAWADATNVLGEQQAAITLAAIYQRADQISSAGGYLRSLTERARGGKFSAWPMVMALLRAKLAAAPEVASAAAQVGEGDVPHEPELTNRDVSGAASDKSRKTVVSDALRKSLERRGW